MLAGIIEEIVEEGQLLPRLPVFAIDSKSVKYNRESSLPSGDFYDIHEQIPWNADVSYTSQVEVELKRVARQDVLDRFMMDTYKNPNDYRAIVLSELRKGCMRTIEDKIAYGDNSTYPKEFDGLDKLISISGGETFGSPATAGSSMAHDQGGSGNGLSLAALREMCYVVKPKPDVLLMTPTLLDKLSQTAFERGLAISNAFPGGIIQMQANQFGMVVPSFQGIPILRSDYLKEEADNSGGKSSGTGLVSVYAIRFGQIQDGGLSLCIGGRTGGPEFFHMSELDELEDYDASGIRLTAYCALALGSTRSLARIHSVDQTSAVTV